MHDTKPPYPPNTRHTEDYYLACLLTFIEGLKANQTQAQIADSLNRANLKTPQGVDWSAGILKQTLKRIRLNADYPSSYHHALLRLVYAGQLTVKQCQPLFTQRLTGVQ